jgi:hypothetical protein
MVDPHPICSRTSPGHAATSDGQEHQRFIRYQNPFDI